MTSTPSYPRRAAISKAVAVDSGYTEAVDSATFASGMQTGSAMPTGYGVRLRWAARLFAVVGIATGGCGLFWLLAPRDGVANVTAPRPLGALQRTHVIKSAQDHTLP